MDKDDLDTLGFFKIDVLGLGMLTALRKTLALSQGDDKLAADTAIDRLAKIRPKIRVSTTCCVAPTRSVSFRSRAERRCRCFHALRHVDSYDP